MGNLIPSLAATVGPWMGFFGRVAHFSGRTPYAFTFRHHCRLSLFQATSLTIPRERGGWETEQIFIQKKACTLCTERLKEWMEPNANQPWPYFQQHFRAMPSSTTMHTNYASSVVLCVCALVFSTLGQSLFINAFRLRRPMRCVFGGKSVTVIFPAVKHGPHHLQLLETNEIDLDFIFVSILSCHIIRQFLLRRRKAFALGLQCNVSQKPPYTVAVSCVAVLSSFLFSN